MNVLLIEPPFHRFWGGLRYYYPLGLAYIAAVVEQSGHQVRIYDAEVSPGLRSRTWLDTANSYDAYTASLENDEHPVWRECEKTIAQFMPDIVGISAISVKSMAALKIAQLCRAIDPAIITVVGADHATACPEEFLKHPAIDYVVRGEGERAFSSLLSMLDSGNPDFARPEGLSFRCDGRFIHNPQGFIADLDQLPFPLRSALGDPGAYRPLDFGLMVTARGCPQRCTFCGVATVWGRKVRYRSVEGVVREMKELHQEYGTDYFSFRDPSFTADRKRTMEFCKEIIDSRGGFRWECLTRADMLDDELVEVMKAAGCDLIRIGVESGSQLILDYLGKGCDVEHIRRGASILQHACMRWSAYLMFGVPLETRQTMQDSQQLMMELDPDFITVARFTPIPGTVLYRDIVKRGLLKEPIDWCVECNQNVKTCFTQAMSSEEFTEAMVEMAQFAEAHNKRRGWIDHRW